MLPRISDPRNPWFVNSTDKEKCRPAGAGRHLVDGQKLNCALSVVSLSSSFFRFQSLHGMSGHFKRLYFCRGRRCLPKREANSFPYNKYVSA